MSKLMPIAAAQHERVDGTGYPHHANAAELPPSARLLAAADRLRAMTEPRAYRPAHTPTEAADELRADARTGGLDPHAASAVLAAAGHEEAKARRGQLYPDGLTAREVEVLRLLARGLTTKQIAAALVISVKTADRHIQNAYAKIGASTRGAATLYTVERGLA
jgi:DNA-binding NarL/FixJ family response regulator